MTPFLPEPEPIRTLRAERKSEATIYAHQPQRLGFRHLPANAYVECLSRLCPARSYRIIALGSACPAVMSVDHPAAYR